MYCVGTKVIIKEMKEYDIFGRIFVTKDIENAGGQESFITEINEEKGWYHLDGFKEGIWFNEEMFEPVPTELVCTCCDKDLSNNSEYVLLKGKFYCKECADKYIETCPESGRKFDIRDKDSFVEVAGVKYEKRYFNENLDFCAICGKVEAKEKMIKIDGVYVCQSCYKSQRDMFTTCVLCGKEVFKSKAVMNADGSFMCNTCHDDKEARVGSYHEFRDFEIKLLDGQSQRNNMTFGFELEIEPLDNACSKRKMAFKIARNVGGHVFFENDGSLNGGGIEVVTEPMTYEYFINKQGAFKNAIETIKTNGYGASNRTGLHIHVGRKYLDNGNLSSNEVEDNILMIVETFKCEIEKFARRSRNEYSQFLLDETSVNLNSVKKAKSHTDDRYQAVNLQNRNTIEFRMFRSTNDYKTLLSAIQLVKNIVEIAKGGNIEGLKWNDIIHYNESFNELIDYNDSLGIESTIQLTLLNALELNKQNYSLRNFIDGRFAVKMSNDSISFDIKYVSASDFLTTVLTTAGVQYKDSAGCLSDELNTYIYNSKVVYCKVHNGERRMFVRISRQIEIVSWTDLVDLWSNNQELLRLY